MNYVFVGPPIFFIFPTDRTLLENSFVTFQCLAVGKPLPTVEWTYRGRTIVPGSRYSIGTSGRNYGALTISNIQFTDRGQYVCRYNNTHGSVVTSASLTVQG